MIGWRNNFIPCFHTGKWLFSKWKPNRNHSATKIIAPRAVRIANSQPPSRFASLALKKTKPKKSTTKARKMVPRNPIPKPIPTHFGRYMNRPITIAQPITETAILHAELLPRSALAFGLFTKPCVKGCQERAAHFAVRRCVSILVCRNNINFRISKARG